MKPPHDQNLTCSLQDDDGPSIAHLLWPESLGGWVRAFLITALFGVAFASFYYFHEDAELVYNVRVFRDLEPGCRNIAIRPVEDGFYLIDCAEPAWRRSAQPPAAGPPVAIGSPADPESSF